MDPRRDALRRELIAEAAWQCFLEYGYGKTSLDDVARRAGLSRPLIYLQFASKKDLFTSLVVDMMERQFAEAREALAADLDVRRKLMRVMEVWFLEPWGRFSGSPERNELLDEAFRIEPAIAEQHRERSLCLLAPLVGGREVADVFRLAVRGLVWDRPDVEVLRARFAVMAERFALP
jgi:AcrR family transcriptional regulator